MKKLLRVVAALLGCFLSVSSLRAVTDAGTVDLAGANATSISIAGSPELQKLANQAFGVHGQFRRVATGAAYVLTFTTVSATQVRVDVNKGGTIVLSQAFNGASQRVALLRAADAAVKATTGLNGFFASKLAFVSKIGGADEIYVGDLFLGDATAVTQQKSTLLTPRWSPDGSRLIYTSYFKSGFPDIFVIDLAARRWTTFVSFKGTNSGARFSPNGSQVAMILSGEGTPEIYVSNAQGRNVARRTRSGSVKSSPCFSPDGSRIVYACEPGPQLYIMPAGGGTSTRVTAGISSYCAEPDWCTADANKIAFTIREGSRYQIAVLDLKTGQSKRVSNAAYDAIEPSWLADGRHLVYTARAANTRSLFILDTETQKSTKISSVYAEKASVHNP